MVDEQWVDEQWVDEQWVDEQLMLLVGCTLATASQLGEPLATAVASANMQPPAAEPSALTDFPLALGNRWVYSATRYDIGTGVDARITATFLITETVVELAEDAGPADFAVRVERETTS